MLKPRRHSRLSRLYSLSRGRERYTYPLRKRFYAEVEEMEKVEQEQEAELLETFVEAWDEKLADVAEKFEELSEELEEEVKQMSRRNRYSRPLRARVYAEGEDDSAAEELDKLIKELDAKIGVPKDSRNVSKIYRWLRTAAMYIKEAGAKAFASRLVSEAPFAAGGLALALKALFFLFKTAGAHLTLLSTIGVVLNVALAVIALLAAVVFTFKFAGALVKQIKVAEEVKELALEAINAKDPKAKQEAIAGILGREKEYRAAVLEALAQIQEKQEKQKK